MDTDTPPPVPPPFYPMDFAEERAIMSDTNAPGTDNTPKPQPDRLMNDSGKVRAILRNLQHDIYNRGYTDGAQTSPLTPISSKELDQALTAIMDMLRESRIDELKIACEHWENNPNTPATYMIDRRIELQATEKGGE